MILGKKYADGDVILLQKDIEAQPLTGAVLARVRDLLDSGGKYAPAAQETIDRLGREWVLEAVPQSAVRSDARFEDGITLLGYEVPEEITAGRPICTTLYWQTDGRLTADVTVFLHLAAEDGFVQAQDPSQFH